MYILGIVTKDNLVMPKSIRQEWMHILLSSLIGEARPDQVLLTMDPVTSPFLYKCLTEKGVTDIITVTSPVQKINQPRFHQCRYYMNKALGHIPNPRGRLSQFATSWLNMHMHEEEGILKEIVARNIWVVENSDKVISLYPERKEPAGRLEEFIHSHNLQHTKQIQRSLITLSDTQIATIYKYKRERNRQKKKKSIVAKPNLAMGISEIKEWLKIHSIVTYDQNNDDSIPF